MEIPRMPPPAHHHSLSIQIRGRIDDMTTNRNQINIYCARLLPVDIGETLINISDILWDFCALGSDIQMLSGKRNVFRKSGNLYGS